MSGSTLITSTTRTSATPTSTRTWTSSSTGTSWRNTTTLTGLRHKLQLDAPAMSNSSHSTDCRLPVPKTAGNPEGKGAHGFLDDWVATEPRGVVAKPPRQVLAELFTSLLVLSASFRYRPVPGRPNYLYWMDGEWSLSLIAPYEWSEKRRAGFAGTCVLQPDMTWTISPSE